MKKHMRSGSIQFGEDTVTKTAAPDLMRVEVEKTRRALAISKDCGLFRVPEVLHYNEAKGVAILERLDVKPVSKAVPWGEKRCALAKNLGAALAIIHRELTLPADMRIPLPQEFAFPHDEVFLHGDLSVDNVCVGDSRRPIAIVDWQMTPVCGGRATYGTRYFDIFWFISNLINRPYTRFLYSNPVAPVARALMESYFQEARQPYDPSQALAYATRFFDFQTRRVRREVIQNSKGRARLLLPCTQAIRRKFVESLRTMDLDTRIFCCRGRSSTARDSMAAGYRESHLQTGKGESYHAAFEDKPYRKMVWQLEKGILDNILATFYKASEVHHFDFSCGTGRILSYLENRTKTTVGVDLSPSMLEVARENSGTAEIIEADLTRSDVLGDRKFNLITAFRFFPNAEAELRSEAMRVLSRHLDDDGYLVFNNHKNTGSTRNRLARLCGRRGYRGMSIAEVKALVAANDLEIVRIYHLCVFPASEKYILLPPFFLRYIESILARIPVLRNFGGNLVFVCRRAKVK